MCGSHHLQTGPQTLYQLVSLDKLKSFPAGFYVSPPFSSFLLTWNASFCTFLFVEHFKNVSGRNVLQEGRMPQASARKLGDSACGEADASSANLVALHKKSLFLLWVNNGNPLFTDYIVNICGREVFLLYACNDKGKPSTGRRKDQPT